VEELSAGSIGPFIGVSAEAVPLGLQKIRREIFTDVAVEPAEG
jgi:hypothetical protein